MFGIRKYKTVVDDKELEVYSRTDVSTRVMVGTTGSQGGNYSHGGRVYLRIESAGLMDFLDIKVLSNAWNPTGFEVIAGGDVEIQALCDALRFAAFALQEQINEIKLKQAFQKEDDSITS